MGGDSTSLITTSNGETRIEDFKIIGKLGNYSPKSSIQNVGDGTCSTVYKVKRYYDGKVYALKKVKMSSLTDKERDNAVNEVRILASIKH